jgi:hypothetical protein
MVASFGFLIKVSPSLPASKDGQSQLANAQPGAAMKFNQFKQEACKLSSLIDHRRQYNRY